MSSLAKLAVVLIFLACSPLASAQSQGQPAAPDSPTENAPKPKLPIPDDVAQAASLATIKDVYKDDYDRAKSPAQKAELAKKMLQEGIQTEGDPAGKFVLLRIARDVATQTGDISTTLLAIDSLAKTYEINALEMKIEALTKLAKSATSSEIQKDLAGKIQPLIDAAVAEENFSAAQHLAGLAVTAARNSKDSALLKQAVAWTKEVEQR